MVQWKRKGHDNVVRSDILEQSLVAVRLWLASVWARSVISPALSVVYAPTLDAERQVAVDRGAPVNDRARMPWIALVIASMQDRVAPYNGYLTNRFGIKVGYINNRRNQIREKIRPIEVGIGLRMRSNSIDDIKAFSALWLENLPNVAMDIQNSQTGARIRIQLSLDTALTIPSANTSQGGDLYDLETTIICRTYTGWTETVGVAQKITVGILQGEVSNSDDAILLKQVSYLGDRHIEVEV